MTDFDPSTQGSPENIVPASWNHEQFVDHVTDSVTKVDKPFSKFPSTVDLSDGIIGRGADELLEATSKDSRKREHGKIGVINLNGKLALSKGAIVGEEKQVRANYNLKHKVHDNVWILNRSYVSREQPAMSMHTHGRLDFPPSPTDISALLSTSEDGGEHASIVITNNTRYLIMRTIDTPEMPKDEARTWREKELQRLHSEAGNELESYKAYMNQYGGASQEQLQKFNDETYVKLQMQYLSRYCQSMNLVLRVATDPKNPNVFTKEAASYILNPK